VQLDSDDDASATAASAEGAAAGTGSATKKPRKPRAKANTGAAARKKKGETVFTESFAAGEEGAGRPEDGDVEMGDVVQVTVLPPESRMFDAFRAAASAGRAPAKKKVLQTNTFMDDNGYLVTKDEWVEVDDDGATALAAAGAAASSPAAPGPARPTSAAAPAPAKPKPKPSAAAAPAAAAGTKQMGLMSFFGRKP
jgi:hypothetical protein